MFHIDVNILILPHLYSPQLLPIVALAVVAAVSVTGFLVAPQISGSLSEVFDLR